MRKLQVVAGTRAALSPWNDVVDGRVERVVGRQRGIHWFAAYMALPVVAVPNLLQESTPDLGGSVEGVSHTGCARRWLD
jgi:hypothetical protein